MHLIMGFFKTVSSYIPRFVAFIILLAVAFGAVPAKDFVVTLDAGHGGHDYGAIGENLMRNNHTCCGETARPVD